MFIVNIVAVVVLSYVTSFFFSALGSADYYSQRQRALIGFHVCDSLHQCVDIALTFPQCVAPDPFNKHKPNGTDNMDFGCVPLL